MKLTLIITDTQLPWSTIYCVILILDSRALMKEIVLENTEIKFEVYMLQPVTLHRDLLMMVLHDFPLIPPGYIHIGCKLHCC